MLKSDDLCVGYCATFWSYAFPYFFSIFVNSVEILIFFANWSGLLCVAMLNFVVPLWMWPMALKTAKLHEENFRSSLLMIMSVEDKADKQGPESLEVASTMDQRSQVSGIGMTTSRMLVRKIQSSKYLFNESESDIDNFDPQNKAKFLKHYNKENNLSHEQSAAYMYGECSKNSLCAAQISSLLGWFVLSLIMLFAYLSIANSSRIVHE